MLGDLTRGDNELDSPVFLCAPCQFGTSSVAKMYYSILLQERKSLKNERRYRNGVPKSTQTRKYKSDGKHMEKFENIHYN